LVNIAPWLSRLDLGTPLPARVSEPEPRPAAPERMRIALCNEVLAGRDFAAQCAYAAALGYDGLEALPARSRR
jgi:hypothetical protein